uniref:Large subunit ribosomal protein LP2 n=1 Tax=Tetraselmis sp. GSL018 TaxID=582737 RepID=A0A061RF74_9CHLO|mmetsp:Transcript_28599/g.68170  ORF Transcript_28599/g.68170 Transcript_28599/m.68170 type:complete len:112 (-) Transcript_28599:64-399(-)|eukprot:CAMPEP_0177589136 /NCGR_PEP_ID=MMETSP0419_2-20121207/6624_1 /TAXON_ID=582737 /ORGANISM="Tetraselmis sp., Strain GSL018" /LENGTH=111 /DNA_ID=CAMNT_0019079433 /DNA_START=82 /DNA_END=417 /DNA_ORIENTATION=+
MRVISAYLLAVLGGKEKPTADDINNILGAVGIEADSANVQKLLSELEGKDLAEVIAAGSEKLASVPSGGGVAVAAGGAAAAGGGGGGAAAAPEPEPEPEEEEEGMDFDLFD